MLLEDVEILLEHAVRLDEVLDFILVHSCLDCHINHLGLALFVEGGKLVAFFVLLEALFVFLRGKLLLYLTLFDGVSRHWHDLLLLEEV